LPLLANEASVEDPELKTSLSTVSLDATRIEGEHALRYGATQASIATRTNTSLLDTPQSVQVVTPEMISDQRVRTLDDALHNVSGIAMGPTGGNTQDAVIQRGFINDSFLRDGVRSPQNRNFSATTERVEVLKGPSSTLYGIQEPSGVVNVVSKRPQYQQRTRLQGDLSSEGGGGGVIDITGPLGDTGLAYRAIAGHEDVDYWRTFGTQRRTIFAPSLAWTNDVTDVLLAYEHADYVTPFDDGTIFANGRPVDVPRNRLFTEDFSRMWGQTDYLSFNVSHALNDQWKLRSNLAINRNEYDDRRSRPNAFNAETGELTRRFDGRDGALKDTRYALVDLLGKVELAGMQHEILLGADHERTRNNTDVDVVRVTRGGFNIYNPVYGTVARPDALDPNKRDSRSELDSTSVFFQDAISLNDRWIVSGALRYQKWEQEEGQGAPYAVSQRISGHEVLPRLGVVYKLSPEASIYANYATSFVPNLADDPSKGGFDPEEGESYELGVKLDIAERVVATAAIFEITKSNIVTAVDDGTSRAVGEARSRGFELDVTAQLTRNLNLIAAYAWTDAKVTDDIEENVGNRLQNVARNLASMSLWYQPEPMFGLRGWAFGGQVRYSGEREGDAANSYQLSSYTVTDLSMKFDLPKMAGADTTVAFGVRNVFDRTYYPSSAVDGSMRVLVGEPRRFEMRVTTEF